MSEKITKETQPKASKSPRKPSAKAQAAEKAAKASDEAVSKTPKASPVQEKPKTTEKPMVTSNTEEGGISGLLWGLLLIAMLGGGGFATQPLWMPYVVDYLPGLEKTADLEPPKNELADRLAEIEQEISRVRESGEAIADLERERGRLNDTFEGVMTRIVELEKQIDYVRGMLQATSPPSDAVDTNESLQRLSSRMNKLEESDESVNAVMERLAKLEQAMADSGSTATSSAAQLSQTMATISERIGTLESGMAESVADEAKAASRAEQQVRAQSLVLAVGHLRESLRTSAPFASALGALKSLGEGDQDIMRGVNELAPYADTGIATMDMLRREFIAAAEAIRAAAPETLAKGSSEGMLDKALGRIKSLVSVRKAGSGSESSTVFGPADKALALLGDGDLVAAVETLGALYGPEAEAAAPWLQRARARLTAETALSRLHVFVVSLLATVNE